LSTEEICYSCKKWWDCKKPCDKVEKLLPKVYQREVLKPHYNPTDEEIEEARRKVIITLHDQYHYSAITLSLLFRVSKRTIFRYLDYKNPS
jgi:hypothetical protein